MCCGKGKVHLPPIKPLTDPLLSLLLNNHPESKNFLANIQKYNGCFQMPSFGAKQVNEGNFIKVQGQVYHKIGSVLPSSGKEPSFLQIFFVGTSKKKLKSSQIFLKLYSLGQSVNFKKCCLNTITTYRILKPPQKMLLKVKTLRLLFKQIENQHTNTHRGRYNAPATKEVALVGLQFEKRDIILHRRDTKLVPISKTHQVYNSLHCPLMFCLPWRRWLLYKHPSM